MRSKIWIIAGLCTLCLVIVSLEGRVRSLRNDMRLYVEHKASDALGRKVTIGALKGGIFRDLFVRDFAIRSSEGQGLFSADEMRVNFKLWDIFFTKKAQSKKLEVRVIRPVLQGDFEGGRIFAAASNIAGSWQGAFLAKASNLRFEEGFELYIQDGKIRLFGGMVGFENIYGRLNASKDSVQFEDLTADAYAIPIEIKGRADNLSTSPELHLRISSDSTQVRGYMELSGDPLNPRLELSLKPLNFHEIYAKGYYSSLKNSLELEEIYVGLDAAARLQGDETIKPRAKLICDLSRLPAYALLLKLNHLSLGTNDLLSDVILSGEFKGFGDVLMDGEVSISNTILNYKPFPDTVISYAIMHDVIKIKEFKLGETISAAGSLPLKKDLELDLVLHLKNLDLENIFAYSIEEAPSISGIVDGTLNIKGHPAKPSLSGHFESNGGRMGPLSYDALILNLSGEPPVVHFKDSRLVKNETTFSLEGDMDLRRFGKSRIFENVKITSPDKMIVWDGWDITKGKEEPKLSLGRDVGDSFHIDFNTFLERDTDLSDEKPKGEVELGYKVTDDGVFKVRFKEDERFLGLEHKKKF